MISTHWLISSFFLIPLAVGTILVLLRRQTKASIALSMLSFLSLLISSLYLLIKTNGEKIFLTQIAGWKAPFGIQLLADGLSLSMLAVCALMGMATVLYSYRSIDTDTQKNYYFPLIQYLFVGVNGSFIAGDIFNLYVCFEIMIISSFALLIKAKEPKLLSHSMKYITMNMVSSFCFLIGVALLYAHVGTLNMIHLGKILSMSNDSKMIFITNLFLIAFAIKAGLFPLFQWLPKPYSLALSPVASLFAGLLTKVGLFALLRTMTLVFSDSFFFFQEIMLFIAGATMLSGVLAAATRIKNKEILSYHIISQVGYMVLGIAVFNGAGFAACAFYLIHHIVAKSNLFFIAGALHYSYGSDNLQEQGTALKNFPWLAFCFFPPAMALAGLPPFSGFFAKYMIIKSAFEESHFLAGGVALLVGVLTLYSMTKIWSKAFWKKLPEEVNVEIKPIPFSMKAPIILLSTLTVLLGVGFPWFYPIFENIGEILTGKEIFFNTIGYLK